MNDSDHRVFSPSRAEREQMVAVAAYYLAERRGFLPGHEQQDWCDAELQIDLMVATMARRGIDRREFERTTMRNALRLWAVEPD